MTNAEKVNATAESVTSALLERLETLEAEFVAMKSALFHNQSILSSFNYRISQCEDMAGIDSSVYQPTVDSLDAFEAELKKPRSTSGDTRDTEYGFLSPSNRAPTAAALTMPPLPAKYENYVSDSVTKREDGSSHSPGRGRRPSSLSGKRKHESKLCTFEGCAKMAHGPTYLYCLRHGGGYRCQYDGCIRSAYSTKFCSKHGGGPRCQWEGCIKGAISNSSFCRRHGGGNRCQHPNCPEGARQGFNFCLNHGGYNPCAFSGCPCVALLTSEFCRQHNASTKRGSLVYP